ncbi:MAG: SprT family zinc-dependent metalloprotease [Kofleriaceae bacterium]
MTTDATSMTVSGLEVAIVRKPIKNLHLGVYPPDGRVRVAAPMAVSNDAVRVAVISRLRWIRQMQRGFEGQLREPPRTMVSGESHYYRGRRYRLKVDTTDGRARVEVRGTQALVLYVRPGTTAADRAELLHTWYRERLRQAAGRLLARWEVTLGVQLGAWGIKRMKTKWGSCNPTAGRVWLNLELIKKPPACLEYVVVHELVHLLVPTHDDRFVRLMDRHLPTWRSRRDELNATPLAKERWTG